MQNWMWVKIGFPRNDEEAYNYYQIKTNVYIRNESTWAVAS